MVSNDTLMIRLQKDPYDRDFNLESDHFSVQKDGIYRGLVVDIKKDWCDYNLRHLFDSLNVSTCWKRVSNIVLMKNTYTFSTCWNVTAAQIILKDKDDIIALCPTYSSHKKCCYWYEDISDKFWKKNILE